MDNVNVTLTLSILDKGKKKRAGISGNNRAELSFSEDFQDGDSIRIESSSFPVWLSIRIDKKIPESQVLLAAQSMDYVIHLDEVERAYPPGTFGGNEHALSVSLADPALLTRYRNLSVNPLDCHSDSTYYPHCTATHESDNHDPRFVARNVVDGVIVPYGHWGWPYTSWGNDQNPAAEIKIEFGRRVRADKTIIHLRADFPHDNWWREMTLVFSDGSTEKLELYKTGDGQEFNFAPRTVEWVKITRLIQCEDDPSPFPALTQWAVYGRDVPM